MQKNALTKKQKDCLEQKTIYTKRSNMLSLYRLISFLLLLTCFITGISINNYWLFGMSFVFLVLFIFLIIRHEKVSNIKKHFEYCLLILEDYKYRLDGRWHIFSEDGMEFASIENKFLEDLDIIGDVSLYKFLNICKSKGGKERLIKRLSNQYIEKEELLKSQQAMKEISENVDFSIEFQSRLKSFAEKANGNNNFNIVKNSMKKNINFKKLYFIVDIMLSIINFTLLICFIVSLLSSAYFIGVIILKIVLSLIFQKLYKDAFEDIVLCTDTFYALNDAYRLVFNTAFSNQRLNEYKSHISISLDGMDFARRIHDIGTLRLNFLSYFLFNGFLPLNTIVIYLFTKFQEKYCEMVELSFKSFEELEVLTSLGIIGQVKNNITLTDISDEMGIKCVNLYHPLLNEKIAIPNNFDTSSGVNIITGSNMSGKTSFLRTIGINTILANAGAFVNGEYFRINYLKIFTSMRIADDLSKGISTFYAEIIRIKEAIEYQKHNLPMLLLVDEIFKGTNSNDRIHGAKSMINYLIRENVILFITTHDFELCDIKNDRVNNYHFEEYYEGNNIKFDYKIKAGKCTTTNAKFLMRLAGIVRDYD